MRRASRLAALFPVLALSASCTRSETTEESNLPSPVSGAATSSSTTALERRLVDSGWEELQRVAAEAMRRGDLKEAQAGFKLAITVLGETPPPEPLAASLLSLGHAYRIDQSKADAIHTLERARSVLESRKTPNDERLAEVLYELGMARAQNSENARALDLFEKSVAMFDATTKNVGYPRALNALAAHHLQSRKYEKALEVLERADKAAIAIHGPDHPERGIVLRNIGEVYFRWIKREKTVEKLKEALAIFKKSETSTPLAFETMSRLADAYIDHEQPDKAVEIMEARLSLARTRFEAESLGIAEAAGAAGELYARVKRPKKGLERFQEAMAISEKRLPETDPQLGLSILRVAAAYDALGQKKKALAQYERALKIMERSFNPEDQTLKSAQQHVDKLRAELASNKSP